MRWFRSVSARPTSAVTPSRRFAGMRLRRALPVLAALSLVLVVSPVPAAADEAGPRHVDGTDRPNASFEITGIRCSIEVTGERTLGNGTTVINAIQRGRTEATIPLLTGSLTLESTTVVNADGVGVTSGRWTLEPDASTGTIVGSYQGSVTDGQSAEIRSVGRGRRSLSGVTVRMNTVSGPPVEGQMVGGASVDETCAGDAVFVGTGVAVAPIYRAPLGAVVSEGTKDFEDAVADLTAAIEGNPNLRLIRTVDHAAAAAGRGLVLPPTTELFFGNPRLGTPLMQASQTAGIDLPQKILIWEDLLGIVRVAYNSVTYLESRHDIDGADGQLTTIAGALAALAGVATGVPGAPVTDGQPAREDYGLVTIPTDKTADQAFADIVAALDAAPPINVVFTLEHDQNAASIGETLRPTKLIVFGNPSLGTPLMQTDRSVALDLPQKILVHTDAAGQTFVSFNDPQVIANRHGLVGQRDILRTIRGALENFATR